ncbi:unnamed protein product [Rhizophagus irregularis]|nr:unnamed protein product [Rhizophagus irregularis]
MSTSTPIPVYTPSEPTGPPPRDLRDMNNIPLVAVIKDLTDFLTVSDRMVVNRDIHNANHRLKHALNLLVHRCRETYEERDTLKVERNRSQKERDELQDELEVQTGLLGLTQNELNIVQNTITGLDITIIGLEANLTELEREFGGMRTTNHRLQQQYNLMRGERNRAIGERNRALGERDAARNRLVYANNRTIEPSSTSSQPSTKYDMAAVGIAAPIFHGREDEDLNLFIDNFLGYINTVGIDPLDDAGAPPGRVRAMGVLRSCMRDEAARWFDAELTGKNWELSSIRLVAAANGGAGATRRAFRALVVPENAGAGRLHPNTYVPGSVAHAYSQVAANAAVTVGDAFFPSRADIVRTNFKVEEQWRRAGGRPTNRATNGLGNHGGPFNAVNVQNQPIVLQGILLDQAFMHMRTNFPTVVEERLQIRFSNLYQEQGEPVRSYYKRVERAGDIVGYNQIMVTDQFYRGLLPENVIEASRIGAAPLNILIDRLSDLERRKGEMFYGLQRRQGIERAKKEELAGYTHPVTPHEGRRTYQEFPGTIKQLQARPVRKPPVYRQPQIKPVRLKPRPRVVQQEDDEYPDNDWDEPLPDIGDDPGAPEWTREDDQHVIDLIMGYETSQRLPKLLQKVKDRRDDRKLARAMRNLDLNDDAMDIDNNVASFDDLKIIPDEEGGFQICASSPNKTAVNSPGMPLRGKATPVKIPAKITSKPIPVKAVTKNDLLNLLRSADFRKLLRKILQEEISSVKKVTEISGDLADHRKDQEQEDRKEDIREDDPMDIDITRLENTKDLLALGGEVNGITIQCLANTCANASFIQRETAEELGLVIDKSITHNISGAPGSGRTFGMVKSVSIQLTPECVITEDLAVLDGYKHREIGLSRTCLKRYNYDVHESREHVTLTCDGKNVFILIVPDVNRGTKNKVL